MIVNRKVRREAWPKPLATVDREPAQPFIDGEMNANHCQSMIMSIFGHGYHGSHGDRQELTFIVT